MRKLDGQPASLGSRFRAAAFGWLWLISIAAPAGAAGVLTIVEGEATIVDGARTLIAAEGLEVPAEAILRTTATTALVRIEWPDGTAADFGPDTQALIGPPALAARGRAPAVYLLRGWLKQSVQGTSPGGGFASPRLEVQPFKGVLVAMLGGDESWVFAESGALQVHERDAKPPAAMSLKPGEVYERSAGARGTLLPRPTPAQMKRVPRSFRDTLPMRAGSLKNRKPEPRPGPILGYAELADWLKVGEPALRRTFPKRFAARAKDSAFRAGLVEHLAVHPEWEPLLFPERFVKPASAPRPRP